jgi:hypothetical protein
MHNHLPLSRRDAIAARLAQGQPVVAAAMATEFQISEDAIRRDLRALAAEGNCVYRAQSAHHRAVNLTRDKLMDPPRVIVLAASAPAAGAERFCMGAAWREVRDDQEFDAVIEMVAGVLALCMEACVTLGMLKPRQAERLAEAVLIGFNHNLDRSGPVWGDRHHAFLRGSARHIGDGAGLWDRLMLRRHHRHG